MCLDNISYDNLPNIKYAYKVFNKLRNRIDGEFYGKAVKKKRWLQANITSISTGHSDVSYQSGFHCFITPQDAKRWAESCPTDKNLVVYKVIVKEIQLKGDQCDQLPCIVCNKIYIIEEIK